MAWPLFLLYDFVWFVDILSLCRKQPSAFHYGKWKRPLWEKDWVWCVDILSLCRKQPSAFHYRKWKRPLWEKDWVCFHMAVSIGIIPATLQCKSIKLSICCWLIAEHESFGVYYVLKQCIYSLNFVSLINKGEWKEPPFCLVTSLYSGELFQRWKVAIFFYFLFKVSLQR